ncbi:MAG: hypothetical protein HQL27_05980 [Candidatus Omnitrophica bacterium]|nr:hypothetical protein [Candidatus Omnitrophota bacterium]
MKSILFLFLLVTCFLAMAVTLISIPLELSIKGTLISFANAWYPKENENGFYGQRSELYPVFYLLIFMSAWLISVVLGKGTKKGRVRQYFTSLTITCFVFFAVISLIQVVKRTDRLNRILRQYLILSDDDYKLKALGLPYAFANKIRKEFPGTYTANLISDLDFSSDIFMGMHRNICYQLLPINVRSHDKQDRPDLLIYFLKKNAKDFVPDNYVIRGRYGNSSLVAVRKDLL